MSIPRRTARAVPTSILVAILMLSIGLVSLKYKSFSRFVNPDTANEVMQQANAQSHLEKRALAIMQCESSLKERALNLKDRDGTASYSYGQWKPETFRMYAIKYGILGEKADWNWTMTIIWDFRTNKYLVMKILQNEKQDVIKSLWPVCYKKGRN